MRDLAPSLPALVLPLRATVPTTLPADVPSLVSDLDRRFRALEAHCHEVGDILDGDAEFRRLDALVTEAIHALADTPARDTAGIAAKADALLRAPINEDCDDSERIGESLARDVVRLLGGRADG